MSKQIIYKSKLSYIKSPISLGYKLDTASSVINSRNIQKYKIDHWYVYINKHLKSEFLNYNLETIMFYNDN